MNHIWIYSNVVSFLYIFLWLIVVSLSIVAACQLAHKFYQKHESANMRTLVISNEYPTWKLELPAITFCHANVASMHRLAPYLSGEKRLRMPFGTTMEHFHESLRYLSIALSPSNKFEKELQVLDRVLAANKMSLEELFNLVSPRCSDFLVMCQYEDTIKNCESMITPSYTPHGNCCSFNYADIRDERKWNTSGPDYHTANFGVSFIMSFLIKSFDPADRISSSMYGDGIKVMIHERNSYPGPSALEFVAASEHETVVHLDGRQLTASNDVLNLKAKDRDCRRTQSANGLYRADNCYVECRENAFQRLCGCVPFYASKIDDKQTICNVSHISCLARINQKANSLRLRDVSCKCLPDCESTMYSIFTTSLPFNAPQFNPSKFYKKAKEISNPTAVHIAFSGQFAILQRRELVLSWINLVSSVGGVFSLFLGFSFISILEIIYFVIHLVLKLWNTLRAKRPALGTA